MNAATPQWSDESIDIGALLARLWSGRWWIVLAILVFGGGFTAAAFMMTPVYRASTVLIAAESEGGGLGGALSSTLGSLGGLASLAGVSVGGRSNSTEEALAVLRSRQFTEGFIAANDLMPKLYADRWDAQRKAWKPDAKVPTMGNAFEYFDTQVRSFGEDKKTGLVTLRVDWKDRQLAALWANDLVARLNAEMRARAIAKADASLGYLQKELGETTVTDTRAAISRLIASQVNNRMLANVTEEYAFRVVDKALPPEPDAPLRPRKGVMIAGGIFLGLVLGMTLVLLRPAPAAAPGKPRPVAATTGNT